jgi:EF hand domain-containing protein
MRPRIVAGIVFAGALAAPLVSGAADPSQSTDKPAPGAGAKASAFQMFDIDKDGFISREEARNSADLSARFNAIDTDRDGKISAEEFNAGAQLRSSGSAQKK